MIAPHKKSDPNSRGGSVVDLLIVVVITAIVVSYVLTELGLFHKNEARSSAAQQFANYLQMARSDSIRRHADEPSRMAQITIFDSRSYHVMMDKNGDGVLDPPVLVNLPDLRLKLDAPLPKTFMFDAQGRAVDKEKKIVPSASITVSDDSASIVINITALVPPSVQTVSAKK